MVRKYILWVDKRKTLILLSCLAFLIVVFFTAEAYAVDGDGAKPAPFSFCEKFKEKHTRIRIDDRYYEFIDTVEFELSKDNPAQSYESKGQDLAFSFVETSAPMNFSLHVKGDAKIYRGGFSGAAPTIKVSLESPSAYRFEYKLGFKNAHYKNSDLVDSVSGKMHVYRAV